MMLIFQIFFDFCRYIVSRLILSEPMNVFSMVGNDSKLSFVDGSTVYPVNMLDVLGKKGHLSCDVERSSIPISSTCVGLFGPSSSFLIFLYVPVQLLRKDISS